MQILLRIARLYWKYWQRALLAYLCLFLSAGMAMAVPRLIGQAIDLAIGQGEGHTLILLAIGIFVAGMLRALFGYGQSYLSEYLSQKVAYDLRNAIFSRLQHLSYAFHDRSHTGQLMSRATSDVEGVRMFIGAALLRGLYFLVMLLVVTAILFTLHWRLALLSLSIFPVIAARTYQVSQKLRLLWMKIQQSVGDLGNIIQENIVGTKVVRAFVKEDHESKKFRNQTEVIYNFEMEAYRIQAFNSPLMNFLLMMATGSILWYGGGLVITGELTAGGLAQFLLYLVLLGMPVRMISWIVTLSSRAISCGQRIFEILDEISPVKESPHPIELNNVKGAVRFEKVSFSYGAQGNILEGISFEVKPGQVVALVGMSGSGKSTIANLIPRFYDVTSGCITIDSIDVRNASLSSVRRNVGIVHQDTFLFSATIMENLRYGKPDATEEEIMEASKTAYLHDFIVSLPDGYNTWVGERGITLSGGQKQRMAIARTILLNPRIIIMDDSTSSVDTETEYFIQRSLAKLLAGRTTFIIAQRLKSIQMSDLVLVMESGRIVQRGTHETLLAMEGPYRKLYELQFGKQVDEEKTRVPSSIEDPTYLLDRDKEAGTETSIIRSKRLKDSLGLSDDLVFGRAYNLQVISRLLKYLSPHKLKVAMAAGATLFHTGTTLAVPFLIGTAINRYIIHGHYGGLNLIILIFIANALLNWFAFYIHYRIEALVGQSVLLNLRNQVFGHLQRLSVSFFDHNETGRIISRVQNDAGQLEEFLGNDILALTGESLSLIGIIVVLLIMDHRLAIMTFAVIPLLFLFLIHWQQKARDSFIKVRQAIAAVNQMLQESITGVRVIQSLSREELNNRQFDTVNKAHFTANIKATLLSASMMPAVEVLMATASALVVFFGGSMVHEGTLLIGTLLAFALYIQRFFDPIRMLTFEYAELQRAMASGSRVFELLDVEPEVMNKPDGTKLPQVKGEIRFEEVSFAYVPGLNVIEGINLVIKPGEILALVGPTGAGKSTIMSLIMRFYDVSGGRVLLDGYDIREINRSSLVGQIGLVLQDPFLFSGTVMDNIRYGRPEAMDEEVFKVAKIVGAHDFIMGMEKGYYTELQERGQNLSMGQRQLVSFARALLVDPTIVLLDEATANVDSYSENLIQQAMVKMLNGRTAVIIAHRLSTIRNADRIIVLDKGRIVEEGNHDGLLSKGGIYAGLYEISHANAGIYL